MISSHILSELQEIATSYGIIDKGNLIKELTSKELEKNCQNYIRVNTNNNIDVKNELLNEMSIKNIEMEADGSLRIYNYEYENSNISDLLFKKGFKIEEITKCKDTVEDYFLRCIGDDKVE